VNVEGIVNAVAHGFGGAVFEQRRNHRRTLAFIDHRRRQPPRGFIGVGALDHLAERFGNALHDADGNAKLAAHPRIGRGQPQRLLDRDRPNGGQRNRAAGRKALHQHAPALPGPRHAADQKIDGNEHIGAAGRPVHERLPRRVVATTDVDAGMIMRHQRQRDANVLAAPQ
jgi:hypothetical protein